MRSTSFETGLRRAEKQLVREEPKLRALMALSGPCTLRKEPHFEPFHSLMRSICHQQLHGKAAETILGRIKTRFGAGAFPAAQALARAQLRTLRSCGLSQAKALAMKDLAQKVLDGTVPSAAILHDMPDEDIVNALTQVRGIGRWTVEMTLMFYLGRLDVLPVDDFGVRKGYALLFDRRDGITPKQLREEGERFRPFRSVFSWYMWRATEQITATDAT
jgi:DNA-3-methyladenine glycosylase II